jgi:glycosyltransferase involved in cell wall biosynthesis
MKLNVSVFIITLNEEKYLAEVLSSVSMFDEIILVDSGSTDNTLSIARSYGAKIYHKEWEGFSKQKQYALSLCKHDWVLNLDGDEVFNNELARAFQKIMSEDIYSGVRCQRNDFFIGKLPSELTKKPNNLRFYKRLCANFDSHTIVHETASVSGSIVFVNEAFTHYGYNSIEMLCEKQNTYSSLKAEEKFIKGKKYNILKLLLIYPVTFLKKYILQRHVFSGVRGFIQAMLHANYAFLKEAKLYEKYSSKDK